MDKDISLKYNLFFKNAEGDTTAGFHHTDVHFPIKKEFGKILEIITWS